MMNLQPAGGVGPAVVVGPWVVGPWVVVAPWAVQPNMEEKQVNNNINRQIWYVKITLFFLCYW